MPNHTEKNNSFLKNSRHKFSTFSGVFTPSILTILGVIMFMRAGFVVGEAGILGAIFILIIAKVITTLTALSIGAVSSNMEVRGGGAYFLISRVLGPEFGGAIGLALFFAQALAVPFYILGFTEALTRSFPNFSPYFQWISLFAALILFLIAYVGANWAIKTQYVILGILALSIIFLLGGAGLLFSSETFFKNLYSGYTIKEQTKSPYSFWLIFAIYFPAVTGILAGVNMSGDLKNPAKSIPKGTLLAVGVGLFIYLIEIILCGGAFERSELILRPYKTLEENALFGWSAMIMSGMFAASLSSALGSYLGAPRILQAVARDNILGILRPFSLGSAKGDEPRRALFLTGVITLFVLLWAGNKVQGGAFNMVASIISMFFLYTYGMINLAAFIEAFGDNPSFRPRFRYFHWSTAFLGTLGCIVAAFLIDITSAFIALIVVIGLLLYLTKRSLETDFTDARRGFLYASVRRNLLKLNNQKEDSKNWRPVILVFSGNPKSREVLITYAVWMESGRGIVFIANILLGKIQELKKHRESAIKQLDLFCLEKNIQAFPEVVVSESVEQGISTLLQTTGMGPIDSNLILFGWSGEEKQILPFINNLRLALFMGKSLVLLKGHKIPPSKIKKQIDIWWRGRKNGSLMLLLAHLLTKNWEWYGTKIRVLRVVENSAGYTPALQVLQDLVDQARISAEIKVIVSNQSFNELLHEHSTVSTCVFLGFEIPKEGKEKEWQKIYEKLLEGFSTTFLVSSVEKEDLLS